MPLISVAKRSVQIDPQTTKLSYTLVLKGVKTPFTSLGSKIPLSTCAPKGTRSPNLSQLVWKKFHILGPKNALQSQ